MKLHTEKGIKEYKVKNLDFTNVMCDLEDRGVDIMGMMGNTGIPDNKLFSTIRIILATLIGETDLNVAGKVLTTHLKNGGKIDEILKAFTEVMENAGFGEASEDENQEMEANTEKIATSKDE